MINQKFKLDIVYKIYVIITIKLNLLPTANN